MRLRPLAALVSCLASASCGSTEATFNTRFASGFSPARHAVSVLGVYKDGQMSAEAWDSIAPRVSTSLGAARCEAAYVDAPSAKDSSPLWAAVDDYTRANGPTDDLLAELAAAAQGDLVMVLTVAGKVPEHEKAQLAPEQPGAGMGGSSARSGMGGAAMRNPGAGSLHSRSTPAGAKDALDLVALLFSVSEKKSVGQVSLEYTGTTLDDALVKFTARLREALPGASCAGWRWDGKVDVDRIRKLGEP